MKQSEIEVGKCYTNGKGTVRKVNDIYMSAGGNMIIKFKTILGRHEIPGMYLKSFASWAKSEVPCEGG